MSKLHEELNSLPEGDRKQKKKNEISLKDELELCPLCGEIMVIKNGKYGYFWSCKKFPNCRGSKTIDRILNFDYQYLEFYDPESFAFSEPFKQIVNILENEKVPVYIKPLTEIIINNFYKGMVDEDSIRGKVSGLLDYLTKNERKLLLAQFSYFIYKVEGDELPERFDYFLNSFYKHDSIESVVKHKEYQITKAIFENWAETPFSKIYGLKIVGEEVPLRQIIKTDSNCKIDIVAMNEYGEYALIEIKRASSKSKSAWGQVHVYREMVKESKSRAAGYIVTSGYPRGIIDKTIGLMGYTIQDGNIVLIPWRKAEYI